MNHKTIQQLNQLNQDFYNTIATSFDETRSRPWEGWKQIIPVLEKAFSYTSTMSVLDLGCGNGRWGEFLAQSFPSTNILYQGLDANESLLESAQSRLNQPNLTFSLQSTDLVNSILDNTLPQFDRDFDIIAVFGVMHHIPSTELRRKLLTWCCERLNEKGILVLSLWHFNESKQFHRHLTETQVTALNIDTAQLEEKDYFLDWQRGTRAIRYCHLVDEVEERELIKLDQWEYLDRFKEDTSNLYLILQKK